MKTRVSHYVFSTVYPTFSTLLGTRDRGAEHRAFPFFILLFTYSQLRDCTLSC